MSLNHRVVIASSLLAILIGTAFAIMLIMVSEMATATTQARNAVARFQTTSTFQKTLLDMETGVRGFTITGDEQFLQPWNAAIASLPAQQRALTKTADTRQQQWQVHQINQATQSYVHDYSIPVVAAARQDPAVADDRTAEGKRLMDGLRTQIDRLNALYDSETATLEQKANRATRLAVGAAMGSLIGACLLIVFFTRYLTSHVTRPVRQAADMADRLAEGDLSARVPETGEGEIVTLERAFNTMGDSLERRQAEEAALRRIATLVAHGVRPSTVFTAVTDEVRRVLHCDGSRILRYEPDGSAAVLAFSDGPGVELPHDTHWSLEGYNIGALVRQSGRPARIDDFANASGPLGAFYRRHGIRSVVGAPITVEDRLWGVSTGFSMRGSLPRNAESRLSDFTELVATAIANANARAELTASRTRIVAASDDTRRRIERDLHDGIQQRLVSLGLNLRATEESLPAELTLPRAQLSEISSDLMDTLAELQETARGIHPAILTAGGLGPAIRGLARRVTIPVELDVRVETRLPKTVEVAAYYVVAEGLANAAKHANATVIHVKAEIRSAQLHLSVRDDGVGGAEGKGGSGLVGLTDRVEALNGTIVISSPVGKGTSLQVDLPLHPTQAAFQ